MSVSVPEVKEKEASFPETWAPGNLQIRESVKPESQKGGRMVMII
jgi:hypothetical protein